MLLTKLSDERLKDTNTPQLNGKPLTTLWFYKHQRENLKLIICFRKFRYRLLV